MQAPNPKAKTTRARPSSNGKRNGVPSTARPPETPPTDLRGRWRVAVALAKETEAWATARGIGGAFDESRGVTFAGYYHRDDEIAERFALWDDEAPPDLRNARELVAAAVRAARLLEREFLEGATAKTLDPSDDAESARAFVRSAHRIIATRGPAAPLGFRIVGDPSPRQTYAALTAAEQRRWRVALMRYLEGVASTGGRLPPLTALAGVNVPFALSAFTRERLAQLLAAWRFKSAGAKASDSGLAGGKWKILASILGETWGCAKSAVALEREWGRASTNRRKPAR